jgi:hypothetical protein
MRGETLPTAEVEALWTQSCVRECRRLANQGSEEQLASEVPEITDYYFRPSARRSSLLSLWKNFQGNDA